MGVGSTLGATQTVRVTTVLGLLETREAFRGVEVEVFVTNHSFEAQKVLDTLHYFSWFLNESLTTHDVDLREREVRQPPVDVLRVNPDLNGAPRHVDDSGAIVNKRHLFERFDVIAFAQRLRVVADGTSDGISNDENEFHVSLPQRFTQKFLQHNYVFYKKS